MWAVSKMGSPPELPSPGYRTTTAAMASPDSEVWGKTWTSSAGKPPSRNTPARYSAAAGTCPCPSEVRKPMRVR